jgi:hypothetical protein
MRTFTAVKDLSKSVSVLSFIQVVVLFLVLSMLSTQVVEAQKQEIRLGKDKIAVNEMYTITIIAEGEDITTYTRFPDIPGLMKAGTSSSSSTSITFGDISSTNSITQNYRPTKLGTFKLAPFDITINGSKLKSKGATIVVTKKSSNTNNDPFAVFDPYKENPFADLESERNLPENEDAFIEVSVNKNEVYVGEPFAMQIAFYVAADNTVPFDFYKLEEQLAEVLKKVKPNNCWEENLLIREIVPHEVKVKNKVYTEYKIFQSTFYPFNTNDIQVPSVGMKFLKGTSLFNSMTGANPLDIKEFKSKAKTIQVKELPPHPLRDKVSTGNFKLMAKTDKKFLKTGEIATLSFGIQGEGNFGEIKPPIVAEYPGLDVYPPDSKENTQYSGDIVIGSKTFSYKMVPHQPEKLKLNEVFSWVYFDPYRKVYDTLSPDIQLIVTGKVIEVQTKAFYQDGFWDIIDNSDFSFLTFQKPDSFRMLINVFCGFMIVATLALFFYKNTL